MLIPVSRAHPIIHFLDRTTPFFRPFSVPLNATSTPRIPLRYQIVVGEGSNDSFCAIANGALILKPNAQLAASCVIEVSAATSSADYAAPVPVRGVISIDFAQFAVHARDQVVHWSAIPSGQLQVTVYEDSGDAYGMSVGPSDPGCGVTVTGVTPADPSPAGTTQYVATLTLTAPLAGPYTCTLNAEAQPSDYAGGTSNASFTITVSP
jgi:hypothetical protein